MSQTLMNLQDSRKTYVKKSVRAHKRCDAFNPMKIANNQVDWIESVIRSNPLAKFDWELQRRVAATVKGD